LANNLILAGAGAGKTQIIVDEAIQRSDAGQKILILTYTESNQKELQQRLSERPGAIPKNIMIKGWFTFLLEDMIRPYQRCVFEERVAGVFFNKSDPHKRNGRTIPGRSEENNNAVNPIYFLTASGNKAHTRYLSRLAVHVCEKSGQTRNIGRKTYKIGRSTMRLEEIYGAIFIDEIQDLVGWDYEIIRYLSVANEMDIVCVGDFRQTIYRTSNASKGPKTNNDKISKFEEYGFNITPLSINRRCVQPICDFSDSIHDDDYPLTTSEVENVPEGYAAHQGLFAVRTNDVDAYIQEFTPVILRHGKNSSPELCKGRTVYNFGKAKGLGFERVLILATENHKKFIAGDNTAFTGGASDDARNKFYVAVTMARYSATFLYDGDVNVAGVSIWTQ